MPDNPQTAFQQDEARRREREELMRAREHGLHSGRARIALENAAQAAKAGEQAKPGEGSAALARALDIPKGVRLNRVVINAPHKAVLVNGELAMQIIIPDAQAGTDSASTTIAEAFHGSNASVGATLKVGISAGNINGNVIAAQTITVTVSGKYFAKITSDATFTETAWEVLNAAATPASTTYIGYNQLGSYTVAAGVLTVTPDVGRPGRFGMVGYKNQTGNEHIWWGDAAP